MPDENPLQPYLDAITPVINDGLGWLQPADISRFVTQAIVQRYSLDKPLEVVSDIQGNDTSFVALPAIAVGEGGATIFGTYAPLYNPTFSSIKGIEYPIGDTPADDADPRDWRVINTPTGYQLQLVACTPAASEKIRVTWTAQHDPAGSTVDPADFYAIADFAAALCLESMAARAITFGDPTLQADVVNYRSKSSEYTSMAKAKRKSYFNHMGIDENDLSVEIGPAVAMGDMRNIMASGVDRLLHSKETR